MVAASLSFLRQDPTATTANAVGTAQIDKTGFAAGDTKVGTTKRRDRKGAAAISNSHASHGACRNLLEERAPYPRENLPRARETGRRKDCELVHVLATGADPR
jgi:hypothetical protein